MKPIESLQQAVNELSQVINRNRDLEKALATAGGVITKLKSAISPNVEIEIGYKQLGNVHEYADKAIKDITAIVMR